MKELNTYLLIIFIGLVSTQCANRLSLEGGERDEQGPTLNIEKSDKNFQRNFKEREFQLSFDEFVKINKPNEQIVISPPIRYSLTPTVRGKKIIFKINEDEVLFANTTYNIQFGDAIQDITESNPIKDLRYVFSTGSVIDSMQVRVQVNDLVNGEPVLGAMVMLYETLSDTMIRKGRPTYFSRTDSSGLAIVQNCRPGNFRVFALVDENRNYQFDLPNEKIGHLDTFVASSLDENLVHDVYIYSEVEPPFHQDVIKLDSQLYAFVIGGEIEYLSWSTEDEKPIETFVEKDTLFIKTTRDNQYVILSSDYSEPDTIVLSKIKQNRKVKNRFRHVPPPKLNAKYRKDGVSLESIWENPIVKFDPDQLRVINQDMDFVLPSDLRIGNISEDGLKINFSWNHKDMRDTIIFLPGAVTTWYATNDTLLMPFRPLNTESLSNLIVKATGLDSTLSYILVLKTSRGEVVDKSGMSFVTDHEWTISGLFPSNHELELITDRNNNGRRDGGWFDKRQLPEPSHVVKIDNLRPDWDVQVEISPSRHVEPKQPDLLEK